ncbi:MAG: hypothetical protein H6750_04655 [Nitrospiraceae bacterium]|nr:hypothetical protein [Nitrospira sp.]MCA9456131.1 hypothetical protein [Nitrospira sp.]MCB9773598.1 hypothetical protein [Nitrospiraceae bacterium]
MKIPTKGVFYSPCHLKGPNGEPFSIEGTQCRTYRAAEKEAEQLQRCYPTEVFVAEVTVKRAKSPAAKRSNRKA